MKNIIAITFLMFPFVSHAQIPWNQTGDNITSGRVGIGNFIPAPTQPLHIRKSVNEDLSLLIENTYSIGTRTFLTSLPTRSLLQTDRDFGLWTNGGGWSEKFTVLNGGNVGIGTTVPESTLDVYSPTNTTLQIRNESYTNGFTELKLETKRSTGPGNSAGLLANASGTEQNGIPTETFGIYSRWRPMVFSVGNGNGNINEYMRISQFGNVGIGTTDPKSFKLAVNGKVWATEVQVAIANPGPDYVFEETYNLPSLTDTENYIKQNKHLPEVPSACEMEEKGINLSEMNMLLLKKVEELTLHLIKLSKQVEEIRTENNTLKTEIKKN